MHSSYRFIFDKESHLTAVIKGNTDFKNLPWSVLESLDVSNQSSLHEEMDDDDFEV